MRRTPLRRATPLRRGRLARGGGLTLLTRAWERGLRARARPEVLERAKFKRRVELPAAGRNPATGRPTCRWCGKDVPPGRRRSWCSQACADEYWIRQDAGFVRQKVFERDRGVCAECGIDTEALEAVAGRFRTRIAGIRERYWSAPERRERLVRAVEEGFQQWASERGLHDVARRQRVYWANAGFVRHLWEADHIVPVSEGGGGCGLDGYRTLCWRCHPKKTGELRRRLNRRNGKQVQVFP